VLIAGGEDAVAGAVSFRFRDGSQDNGIPVDEAVARIADAVRNRARELPGVPVRETYGAGSEPQA
jgi:threonyl-tRNA synthetase